MISVAGGFVRSSFGEGSHGLPWRAASNGSTMGGLRVVGRERGAKGPRHSSRPVTIEAGVHKRSYSETDPFGAIKRSPIHGY
jgi:hypothetical protein